MEIVIVSFNTAHLLADCLCSIPQGAEELDYRTIVVDNGSKDGSAEMLARDFPHVRLIQNSRNRGFGAANNQGIHASTGRYVVLLNSDTRVLPGALKRLVDFMEARPQAGACGPRLARPDGRTQPFAFGGDPTPRYLFARGWTRLIQHRPLHDWETQQPQPVDWVSAACLIARSEALEQIGGFDERYFMYFEDNDLCLRLRRAGWQVWYDPDATITHLGGGSVQADAITQWYDASLRYFYRKHYATLARLALEMMLPFYRRLRDSESAHAHRD